MKCRFLIFIFMIIILQSFVSGFLVSDQGTNVKEVATGNLLELGNLTILIYDNTTGGTEVYNQTFSNAIVNGSWNVMTDPDLEYGVSYWKDYQINGEDLDFDGNERLEFQSSVGMVNNVSYINFSLINSCAAGSSIRAIYANGSVACETDDSGSGGSNITHLENLTNTNITSPSNRSILYYDSDQSKWIDTLFETFFDLFFGGKTTDDLTQGSTNLYDNQSWNESYADTLYAAVGSSGNSSWNESYADTLYADISVTGDNESWNESYADTQYYGIDNPSGFYNSSDFSISDYYTKVQIGNFGYYNNSNFPYTHLSNFTDDIGAGVTYTHLSNFTDNLGDRGYTSNLNFSNDAGYYNASDFSISDYYTKADINGFSFYNATDFDIADYITSATLLGYDYYNSSDFDIADYATNVKVDSLGNWSADSSNYYNTTQTDSEIVSANTSMKTYVDAQVAGVSGDNSSWNESYADTQYADISVTGDNSSWNQSFADTLYYAISNPSSFYNSTTIPSYVETEVDPAWTGNQTNYYNKTSILAFGYYNSSDFVITDYYTKSQINSFDYYNSSDFSISDYVTSATLIGYGYYNSSDFDIADYSTTATILGYDYYNSSDFVITDYYTKSQINGFNYYNSSDFSISDYYSKSDIDSFSYYNASDFDINDYFNNITNFTGTLTDGKICIYDASTQIINCTYTDTTGGNTSEEMQDAIGGSFNSTLVYDDTNNVIAANESYFDTLYQAIGSYLSSAVELLTSNSNYINLNDSSGSVLVDFNETKLNETIEDLDTDTTYTAGSNLSLDGTEFNWDSTWVDTLFVRFTELVSQVGNWSADKGDYYTSAETDTEIQTANASMKTYVDAQDNLKLNLSGGTITGNLSIGNYAITNGSGAYIYHNGTGWIIHG